MRRFITVAAVAAVAVLGTACEKSTDSEVVSKLKDIDKRLRGIEARLDKGVPTAGAAGAAGRGAAGQMPQGRPPGPDPATTYAVPVAGAPWRGAEHAKVTIVEAFDFACPYCERVRETIDQLLVDYKGDLRVVYRNLVVHPAVATLPAQAACAANLQGKYYEMNQAIWDKGFKANRNLAADNIDKLAAEIGLDMDRYRKDRDGACQAQVARDQQELRRVGASGTPGFFINGRFLAGARPIEHFKALIDEELKKANDRIASGTKADAYYDEWVLGKGKTSV